ncbi:NACHT, LRR and PYD domains-containing protein 1 homolog [Megalobrama amblycephala]|uniref:NACHT, LRR and PYD domains-containing protein 1 homolog n=1 Tax=Megalobrama amblycephala TaxID=75352 RepID=UPI0020146D5B|nr:NACHT, LRR and PYD domains-containing protein 1 homolog [Megalobrama amblycephala]
MPRTTGRGGAPLKAMRPKTNEEPWLNDTTCAARPLNGLAPQYITDLIQIYTPARSLRSEGQFQLVVPKTRLKTRGYRAFSVVGTRLCNPLPPQYSLSYSSFSEDYQIGLRQDHAPITAFFAVYTVCCLCINQHLTFSFLLLLVLHRFSDPKPSGLNIHPLLNCQSCVHIADSDQWVQIEPSACTDGGSKFRVSTDPGRYECVRTRMRWVCDCDVILQYCTVDGHFLNTELERLQCNRIAPVIDVTVISGKLEEVHLPHYACLGESDPSLKDAVKVLTVKDEGITTEPVQLTRFHAKIVQPSFSLTTLIISWIMRVDEHCDLLLYMHSKVPLILHVYFFPVDDCAKEKVEKNEKSSYPIKHPRPDRPFRMKTPHILDVPGASIHPKEGITLRRETDPNFFKVKTRLENDLQMTLTREEDQKTVWTAIIEKDELDQINPKRDEPRLNSEADKAEFFDNHWPDLIQGVKNVGIIVDKLRQQKIIHEEQYSEITQSLTSQESMRKICDIIRKHSDAVKAKFISVLQKDELYLLEHLYDSTP